MNRTVGLTLRRTAGGGIIFAIGLGVLSTRPQAAMPVLGSTTPLPTEHVMTYYERPIPTPSPEPPAAYPQASQPAAAAIVVKSVAKAAPRVAKPVRVPVLARATPAPARPAAPAAQPVNAAPSGANAFSYGYCTWWVAHKRAIPWRGDAAAWW